MAEILQMNENFKDEWFKIIFFHKKEGKDFSGNSF